MTNKVNTEYLLAKQSNASEWYEPKKSKNALKIKSSILLVWYQFQMKYQLLLLEGCLDQNLRGKILHKIEKQSQKLNKLKIKG
ncbi:hypothetical protein V7266_10600 [Neobacillus drentensis]|uniref:hypothetical protein n=1 Tax=Neobacillus drentensis TaxID=220684 RepID=UPI002FFF6DE9